jgi:hypothetical protein
MFTRTADTNESPFARLLGAALLTAALLAGPGAAAAFADGPPGGRPEAPAAARDARLGEALEHARGRGEEHARGRNGEHEQANDQDQEPASGSQALEHRAGFVGTVVTPNQGAKTFGLQVSIAGTVTTLTVHLDADTAFAGRDHEDLDASTFFAQLADLGPGPRATVVARERDDAGRLVANLVVLRPAGSTADEA